VEVVFDVAASATLSEAQKERAVSRVGPRIAVAASEHRSQHRNRLAARQRVADRLREALAPPPLSRVPTKPTRGSQRRRVEGKRRRGQVKSLRGRVRPE
jgi:ribosome-associated protein